MNVYGDHIVHNGGYVCKVFAWDVIPELQMRHYLVKSCCQLQAWLLNVFFFFFTCTSSMSVALPLMLISLNYSPQCLLMECVCILYYIQGTKNRLTGAQNKINEVVPSASHLKGSGHISLNWNSMFIYMPYINYLNRLRASQWYAG